MNFKMRTPKYSFLIISIFMIFSCSKKTSKTLYELLDAKRTGIEFSNTLAYDYDSNVYRYRNFYNGGGVAIGDINNDGLIDLYLTSNQNSNKLYLNKGNFEFEDITEKAKVRCLLNCPVILLETKMTFTVFNLL